MTSFRSWRRSPKAIDRSSQGLKDYIVTPNGRRIMGMNQVLEYAPAAREIQIYQDKEDEIQVRIVAGSGFGESDKEALRREFQRRIGTKMRIILVRVPEIPRLPNGQLRDVISKLKTWAISDIKQS